MPPNKRPPPSKTRKRNKRSLAMRKRFSEIKAISQPTADESSTFIIPDNLSVPETNQTIQSIVIKSEHLQPLPEQPETEHSITIPEVVPMRNKLNVPLFCELCLRKCTREQSVKFSRKPRKDGDSLSVSEGEKKLTRCIVTRGVKLDGCAICLTCWKMVEMIADFRKSVGKCRSWVKRYGCGLEEVDEEDSWLADGTVESLNVTHVAVKNHMNRVIAAKAAARKADNTQMVADQFNEMMTAEEVKIELDDEQIIAAEVFCEPIMEDVVRDVLQEPVEEIKKPIEVTIYTCGKCSRKFDSKQVHSVHVNRCKGVEKSDNLYSCTICSANFVEKRVLKYHMNKHKGIKPYACRVNCKAGFYSDSIRKQHEQRCRSDPLVCPVCGVLRKTRKDLDDHMVSHSERTLPCETCGKMFKTTRMLRKHQSVHSDERNWTCDVCGKGFKSANAATVHKRIHTQEKPFNCHICGQGFAYKCLVQPHIVKCHTGTEEQGGV